MRSHSSTENLRALMRKQKVALSYAGVKPLLKIDIKIKFSNQSSFQQAIYS